MMLRSSGGGVGPGVWQFGPPGPMPHRFRSSKRSSSKLALRLEPRHLIILCCFLATLCAYVERVGFSIAFTGMAASAGVDERVKGAVMSAFYWGYALSQIPGGWAAQRWGGAVTLSFSFALWSAASLLTPRDARSALLMSAARVGVGVAQGFLIPAVHTVLSAWVIPAERARAVSLTTSGMYLGSALAMQTLPALGAALGYSSLPRLVGGLGLGWLALWRLVLFRAERSTAAQNIPVASQGRAAEASTAAKGRPAATPWTAMLQHPAIWAIVVSNFCFHYAFYVVMNWLPTYFERLFATDLSAMGALKTLPYLVMFGASNAGGWAGDALIHRGWGVASARKAVNSAGFAVAAAALLLMPHVKTSSAAVGVTTLVLGACGFARGGFSVNHMDIAPKFAGMVMGISNTAGTVAGIVGVAATGFLLDRAGGAGVVAGWDQAVLVSALTCLLGLGAFAGFARGERLFGADGPAAQH